MKTVSSKKILKTIKHENESRRKWLLKTFSEAAVKLKRVKNYKVWQDGSHPIGLDSGYLLEQKINYIHENPVNAGYVDQEEYWKWSSAIDYVGGKGCLEVTVIE